MPKPWTVLSRRTLISDPWLRLHAEQVRTGQGIELDPWYVVEAAHWVTVVPVLPDGRLVLVEQYRHGAERICRELPAGNIDAGEDPVVAALRELAEETGFQAIGTPVPLGTFWPEPARSRATATGFLVRCAATPQPQRLEHSEDIAVALISQQEAFGPTHGGIVHGAQLAFLLMARPLL